jgi:hypothetical protein
MRCEATVARTRSSKWTPCSRFRGRSLAVSSHASINTRHYTTRGPLLRPLSQRLYRCVLSGLKTSDRQSGAISVMLINAETMMVESDLDSSFLTYPTISAARLFNPPHGSWFILDLSNQRLLLRSSSFFCRFLDSSAIILLKSS